jgi:hypothetical protein
LGLFLTRELFDFVLDEVGTTIITLMRVTNCDLRGLSLLKRDGEGI